jgi:Helix-turn-helix domain
MNSRAPIEPGTLYLTTAEAAAHLRLKSHTLEQMRYLRTGPKYHKFGGMVRYALEDLQNYANDNRFDPKKDWRR